MRIDSVGNNDDIRVDDNSIIFTETKNGRVLVLNQGENPRINDTIGIHPYNDLDEYVTHGLSYFQPGDEVIVRVLKSGDEAAFKPGFEGMYGCLNVYADINDISSAEREDGSRQYHAYEIELAEPFYKEDHDLNMYMEFDSEFGQAGMQPWFPYGGVAIGFSEDGSKWYWHNDTDPYLTLGEPAILYYAGPEGFDPEYSDNISMGDIWCVPDALNITNCAKLYGPQISTLLPFELNLPLHP